jgi:hypothetical protein
MVTTIIVVIVALLLVAALRLWLTASRLDRLHVRTEAAWAALEGALARRIVAARALAAAGHLPAEQAADLRRRADAADRADRVNRLCVERELADALAAVPPSARGELAEEVADAAERVVLATQFYNDAVRDTRALRASWFTRFFRLAGHARLPEYFELVERKPDGTPPAAAPGVPVTA